MKDGKKKRKATDNEDGDANHVKKKASGTSAGGNKKDKNATEKDSDETSFKPLTLKDIRDRLGELEKQIPELPASGFYNEGASPNATSSVIGVPPDNLDKALLKSWASRLQVVLEELGLLLCCVSSATYRWGTDRSGAADQNLSLLNDELNSTQDQIASRVTPRLRNVLTPVVDLVVEKTITTKSKRSSTKENGVTAAAAGEVGAGEDDMVEVKQNVFTRHLEDPDFVHLCYEILARNASMMRLVVITNFQKMQQVIKDYLSAQNNDTQHHREFAY